MSVWLFLKLIINFRPRSYDCITSAMSWWQRSGITSANWRSWSRYVIICSRYPFQLSGYQFNNGNYFCWMPFSVIKCTWLKAKFSNANTEILERWTPFHRATLLQKHIRWLSHIHRQLYSGRRIYHYPIVCLNSMLVALHGGTSSLYRPCY